MVYAVRRNLNSYPLGRGRQPLLGRLDIELTERCNNKCIHCYIALPECQPTARAHELDTATWQDILRQAADLGALAVRITGGEPLLRNDFCELYLYARRLGLQVLLFTNARLISTQLAELFARVPPMERIEVSVYGLHRESYEAVTRVIGSYEQFWAGVQHLLEYRIPFIVKGALLPPNRAEVDEFAAWAATIPWMEHLPTYSMYFDLRGRRDSMARNRVIAHLRVSPEEVVTMFNRDKDAYRKDMKEFCGRFMGPDGDQLFACGAGQSVAVDAYGILQPCLLLRDPARGYDLRQGSLRDALTTVFPRLRELRATNADYLVRCARCFLKGLCEQCPAKSWSEHGRLDTPVEYLCRVAHAQARDLGLLADGERAWEVADGPDRVRNLRDS